VFVQSYPYQPIDSSYCSLQWLTSDGNLGLLVQQSDGCGFKGRVRTHMSIILHLISLKIWIYHTQIGTQSWCWVNPPYWPYIYPVCLA